MGPSTLFSTIEVARQVFYRSSLAYAIVNLKPIVPGHVLVIPSRVVTRLSDLNDNELSSLMFAIKQVGGVIEQAYGADALTIACQDGKAAGQSVPHVHFHILPRKVHGDSFSDNNDAVYPALERNESTLKNEQEKAHSGVELKVDADDQRLPRSLAEMEKEAEWLSKFFEDRCTL